MDDVRGILLSFSAVRLRPAYMTSHPPFRIYLPRPHPPRPLGAFRTIGMHPRAALARTAIVTTPFFLEFLTLLRRHVLPLLAQFGAPFRRQIFEPRVPLAPAVLLFRRDTGENRTTVCGVC